MTIDDVKQVKYYAEKFDLRIEKDQVYDLLCRMGDEADRLMMTIDVVNKVIGGNPNFNRSCKIGPFLQIMADAVVKDVLVGSLLVGDNDISPSHGKSVLESAREIGDCDCGK